MGRDGVYTKDDERLELRYATFTKEDPRRRAQGELLQAQLAAAGIQLSLFNTTFDTLFEWITDDNFDIASFNWLGNPFALSGSQDLYRRGSGNNVSKFADTTVDALYQQGLGELDPVRAAAIGNQIDQQLWAQLPSIPLYQVQSLLAFRQDLLNVQNNPTTETSFWNAGSWGFAKP
jgi:peptide/nickel transport system substrate-binding protein